MTDKKKIQQALENFKLPAYDDIPDVGLYLVQVVNYINGFLADFPDMHVTASMISNYVKQKLVSKPNKKMYSREQIAYFIFIALAKTVISMEDIQTVFAIQERICSPRDGYEYFCREMMNALEGFYDEKADAESRQPEREEVKMLYNIAGVVAHKMYLNRYFSVFKLESGGAE